MKNLLAYFLFSIILFSCSKNESSLSSTSTTTSTTQTSETFVKLTVLNADGISKSGVVVMMFKSPVTQDSVLPYIEKEVISDTNGLAFFDLDKLITSSTSTTYFFEAFRRSNDDLIWESITHPSFELTKGKMVTSSILVN